MNLSATFPPNILPVRSGVYRTQGIDIETGIADERFCYSYFDAAYSIWGCSHDNVKDAFEYPEFEFAIQNKQWYGLAEEFKS